MRRMRINHQGKTRTKNGKVERTEMQVARGYTLADLRRFVDNAEMAGLPEDTPVYAEALPFTGVLRKLIARTKGAK